MMPNPAWNTLHQALLSGSKSTALNPLGWLIGLTLVGSISAQSLGSPPWFADILGLLCIVSIIGYMGFYFYFAKTDKDALRSEKYSIQKLAIQKGFIGDDQTGYIPIDITDEDGKMRFSLSDQSKGLEDEE
jgi:threonine/homoserine/homoserine lactone efflux protein